MFALGLVLVLMNLEWSNTGYVEIVETGGCHSCKLVLTCRRLTSVIAVLEVNYTSSVEMPTLRNDSGVPTPFPPVLLRDALNHRCSGMNHCTFIYSEDCPGCDYFEPGNITIKYACITEDRIKRYCNSDILLPKEYISGISEGFIHNPGYPRFYSGQQQCRWKITAHSPQKIKVTLLDVSLIVDNVPSPFDCTDVIEIVDTGQVIHSSCRQEHPPTEIISLSQSLEIVLTSRNTFNPRRGMLMYYTVVGCPELVVPSDAYVVYRDNESLILSCCLGYHFPDGNRRKSIKCMGSYWNTTLPVSNCQQEYLYYNQTDVVITKGNTSRDMSSDLIAPIIIIVVLFAINGVVLYYINRAKKRQKLDRLEEEELGGFTSHHESEA